MQGVVELRIPGLVKHLCRGSNGETLMPGVPMVKHLCRGSQIAAGYATQRTWCSNNTVPGYYWCSNNTVPGYYWCSNNTGPGTWPSISLLLTKNYLEPDDDRIISLCSAGQPTLNWQQFPQNCQGSESRWPPQKILSQDLAFHFPAWPKTT